VRGEMPVKPSRESLLGGAPKAAAQPPREVVARPVVATRAPRERTLPWQEERPRVQPQAVPESRYVKPPLRSEVERSAPQRPPFGAQAGPERAPPPQPPRLREVARPATSPGTRTPPTSAPATRAPSAAPQQPAVSREPAPAVSTARPPVAAPAQPARPAPAPQPPSAQRAPVPTAPARAETRPETRAQPLPGKPANQTYRGEGQKARSWEDERGSR
jgi:hypothetical protein